MKKNAIRINWPRANNTKWKTLDEEFFHFTNKSERIYWGEIAFFHKYCGCSVFRTLDQKTSISIKELLREDKKRKAGLKKLKEIPGDKTLIKQQLSKIKEKILVISQAENARKLLLKKEKLEVLSIRTHLNSKNVV